jgi:hypothetical protein
MHSTIEILIDFKNVLHSDFNSNKDKAIPVTGREGP